MPKRLGFIILLLSLVALAACGGDEEPAATPTPLATFTPTAAPTAQPSATAAGTPTAAATATEEQVASEATATETPAAETTAATTTAATPAAVAVGGDGFASPLPAPDSPLPPPVLAAAGVPPAPFKPVTGSWQLQTIKLSSSASANTAPAGYRVAFGPAGVVRVMGDCKTGRGSYSAGSDGTLRIDITYSDVRCAPDSLADPFAGALNAVTSYRFDGDQLLLAYGAQDGEMGLARTAQMASFGAPFLNWSNLQNSTFLLPEAPAGDGQAPLVDGEFRARLASNTAAPEDSAAPQAVAEGTPVPPGGEFVVSLATMHTYGVLETPSPEEIAADPEITAEVSADAVVVLVVEDDAADSAPRSYVAPVLNGGGLPLPLPLELLGPNVLVRDLRWDGERLTVDYDQEGAAVRRVYRFDSDHFVLDNEEQLAARPAKARLDLPAQPVTLGGEVDARQASMTGAIAAGEVHPYRLPLEAGQQLSVTLQSPYDNVWLSIFGLDDRTVLRSIRSDTVRWAGAVPSTQEYLISAVAPGSGSPYTLTIQATGGGAATAAAPPTAPAGAKIVHLVVDGLPADEAVLSQLQAASASVDFFVTAEQVMQSGSAPANAEVEGHGIGLIASPITALTSDGRDALFAEVSAARQALASEGATGQSVHCLRLPTAASDGYTRAAAAELGFDVLQWDIDGAGVAADALAAQLFPGAVVRLDGDDGAALAATFQALLPVLAQQGYSVQSLCR